MENKKKFKLQLPHVYTLAFILIIVFAILTWILPSGQFDRQLIDTAAGEREVAVAGTYHVIDKVSESGDLRQGLHEILMAPTRGIQAAADVVAFVLLIGGTFQILTKTNAMNRGIRKVILRLKGKGSFTDTDSDDSVRNWWNDIWYVGGGYSILCYVDPYFLCNGI